MKKISVYVTIVTLVILLLALSYELFHTKHDIEQNNSQSRERAFYWTLVDVESSFYYLIDLFDLEGFTFTDYEKKLLNKAISREARGLGSLRSNIHVYPQDFSKGGFEASTTVSTFLLFLSNELSNLTSNQQVNVEKINKFHTLIKEHVDDLRKLIEIGHTELLEEDNLILVQKYFQVLLEAMK